VYPRKPRREATRRKTVTDDKTVTDTTDTTDDIVKQPTPPGCDRLAVTNNLAPGYCSKCRRFYQQRYYSYDGFLQANPKIPLGDRQQRAAEYLSWVHSQPDVVPCEIANCGMLAEFIDVADLERNKSYAQRLRLRRLAGQA
jgi:hypothetical protein